MMKEKHEIGDFAIVVPPGSIDKVLVSLNKTLTEDRRVLQEGEKMDGKHERIVDILDEFKKSEKGKTDLMSLAMEMFGVLMEPVTTWQPIARMATDEEAAIERITEHITKELDLLADTRLLKRDQEFLLWIKIRELRWNERASKERDAAREAGAADGPALRLEAACSQGMARAYSDTWRQMLFPGCSVEDETLSQEVYEKARQEWKEKAEMYIGPKPGFRESKKKGAGLDDG